MKNVTKPRTVSLEDALRNLAAKLTGTPPNELPHTQEGIVQYLAERIPSVDELIESAALEIQARLERNAGVFDEQKPATEDLPAGSRAKGRKSK